MMDVEQLGGTAMVAAATAAAAMICWGIAVFVNVAKARTHNAFVLYILGVVGQLASLVVGEVSQAYVEPLKKSGRWTEESAKEALNQALAKMRGYLGADGLAKVATVLGAGGVVEEFLRTYIESSVSTRKFPALPTVEVNTLHTVAAAPALQGAPPANPS